jgi:hypothetical protein
MVKSSYGRRSAGRRGLLGVLLGAAILVALPAALVWACVPSASIGFDNPTYKYKAGEAVKVTGRQFSPSTAVALTLQQPSGASGPVGNGVSTDGAGSFEDSFTLAGNAATGDYVVQARVGGTTARETFTVVPAGGSTGGGGGGGGGGAAGGGAVTGPGAAVLGSKSALATALAKCKKKYRTKKASASKRRKLAKKYKACVKKAKKANP